MLSTSIAGIALLKVNPLKVLPGKKENNKPIEVKINPDAVKREKPGKKNG